MDALTDDLIVLFRKLVCDNQTHLPQYTFLASKKHKKIRKVIEKSEFLNEQGLRVFIEDLESALKDLEEYLYSDFENSFRDNYKHICEYFYNRSSKYKPRVSIKVITEGGVASLIRRPNSSAFLENFSAELNRNSAFDDIVGGDKHYLCNNIPKALSEGNYKNARLDKDAFEEQLEKFPTGDMSDDEWVRCWHKLSFLRKGEKVFPPIQMCYRSTLVIPMSLLTKNLRQEFIEHFKVDSDAERIVFGFLCFDHPEAGFFEDSDVHFGYIVADFLSLYLIQQLLYTDYSSVYQLAHTAIAEYRK